ncbi:hypothetical protein FFLO_00656 [Filobasidium floriforme]|uniref:Kinesin motor domain-containing protein n=1 Tax=Filobasidium floriforme TaxID=5210 RepID=A0A8K0JW21_9TREE|nr:hypothetical protein FFLO_00656 [Filobasidium floriforme]
MSGNNIKTLTSFRPFNRLETENGSTECIDVLDEHTVRMKNGGAVNGPEGDGFTFDRVFPSPTGQAEIFDFGVKGIVEDVMEGFNGTLFCYGQTGSGKTFSKLGADIDNVELKGLIPRITEQIFASIAVADANVEYTVKVSYMEIYMERIKDLLAPANDNLSIHEEKNRGVYVKGLTDVYVGSEMEVFDVMKAGARSRVVASTQMNAESSRSHSIFLIAIHQRNVNTGSQKSGNLYLVDLAGSEKVGKTGASGQTLEEAKKINKSLSALGMVINSLTDGKSSHVPYRDSKLTRILQESLGGNSRTTLIINCSPATYNEAETLGTLRFGMRAKSIKNKARVNTEMSPAELKILLSKTKGNLMFVESYRDALLGEVGVWRAGNKVEESDWATEDKVRMLMGSGNASGTVSASTRRPGSAMGTLASPGLSSSVTSRAGTPNLLDAFKDPSGRVSPAGSAMASRLDADEREEFLRRENELSDAVTEKESSLATQERLVQELRAELSGIREDSKAQTALQLEVSELRAVQARLEEEVRENGTSLDVARDKEGELTAELKALRLQVEELQLAKATAVSDDREKRKAEMLSEMMAKIETGGKSSETGLEALQSLLVRLDGGAAEARPAELLSESKDVIRQHLLVSQTAQRDSQDRLRRLQDDVEVQQQRREELERILVEKDAAYEDLLAQQSMEALGPAVVDDIKAQFEAQYASKQSLMEVEEAALRKRIEHQEDEIVRLHDTIEDQTASIDNLNRLLAEATSGVEGGREFAQAVQELERTKRSSELQQAEFESVKRNLMRDVTDRCEKVIELQMQLDEYKEKYKAIARSTNIKAQLKRAQMLEYNMSQMEDSQRRLVHQNTQFKRELNAAERKLSERRERIINLEERVGDYEELKSREDEMVHQIQLLQTQLAQAARQPLLPNAINAGRIAKPMRGGGGIANIQNEPAAPSAIASNTKQRLADDIGGTMRRQSWFMPTARGNN